MPDTIRVTCPELAASLARVIQFAAGVELDEADLARMVFEDVRREQQKGAPVDLRMD